MSGEKILLVEDEAMLAELASKLLAKEGYVTKTAPNGLAALDIAVAWRPDVILLDVVMPGMQGYSVAARLRQMETTKHIPIMMLTAKQSIEDKSRSFDVGADDYLTKPFKKDELLLRIRALLHRSQQVPPSSQTSAAHVIAFFSLRGGSGCTSLAVNAAVGQSLLWHEPTVLVDLSLPIGVCDVMLNLKPRRNLGGLARHNMAKIDFPEIQSYLTTHDSGLQLLAGVGNPAEADLLSAECVSLLLDHLQRNFRTIVIDTSHSLSKPIETALERADEIIMLITPDIVSVRSAVASLKTFDDLGFPREKTRVVLNASNSENGLKADRIERVLEHPIERVFLHDDLWTEAINLGKPIIQNEPGGALMSELESFVWELTPQTMREQVPSLPTELWKRLQRRMNHKKPA